MKEATLYDDLTDLGMTEGKVQIKVQIQKLDTKIYPESFEEDCTLNIPEFDSKKGTPTGMEIVSLLLLYKEEGHPIIENLGNIDFHQTYSAHILFKSITYLHLEMEDALRYGYEPKHPSPKFLFVNMIDYAKLASNELQYKGIQSQIVVNGSVAYSMKWVNRDIKIF